MTHLLSSIPLSYLYILSSIPLSYLYIFTPITVGHLLRVPSYLFYILGDTYVYSMILWGDGVDLTPHIFILYT